MYEKRGSYKFHYRYDAFGNLAGITREDASGSLYRVYVLCNSRGDVLELRNQNGTVFAKYVYDAWGNVLHVLNSAGNEITSTTNLANQNPFRYRGYYYDSESGMYYLQSRYYDPVTGRFLNADNIVTTEQSLVGTNVFAYCGNNPVVSEDETGHFWDTVFDVVSIVVSIIDVVKHPKKLTSWLGLALDIGCAVVPFATGGGTAIRAASKADDAIDAVKTYNKIDNVADTAKTTKKLHRPYIRKSTRSAVEAAAPKLPDGTFIDINTNKPIIGKYDLGHVSGHEFWRERNNAMAQGWSQKQFNDYMNNPKFYQIEDPISNRSHIFEMKG